MNNLYTSVEHSNNIVPFSHLKDLQLVFSRPGDNLLGRTHNQVFCGHEFFGRSRSIRLPLFDVLGDGLLGFLVFEPVFEFSVIPSQFCTE